MRSELRPFVYEGLSAPALAPAAGLPAPPSPAPRPGVPLPGRACRFPEVLDRFTQGSHTPTPAHLARIRRIAECVRDSLRGPRPIRRLLIVGHASEEGREDDNLKLGQRRADAVLNRLRADLESVQPGLSARITLNAESRGEGDLTGRGRERDRRVVIDVVRTRPPRPPGPPRRRGCPPHRERIRLHLKIVTNPRVPIATMLRSMREVYGPAGFRVEVASTERLRVPPALVDIDLHCPGSATSVCCPFPCASAALNPEVVALFANRRGVGPNDVVVYFVRAFETGGNGCCAHPPGRPGVMVASRATRFTLAHEVGHILGLPHVARTNTDRLMVPSTNTITNPPPDLTPAEIRTMTASRLTVPC